jgi:hypothetical protein
VPSGATFTLKTYLNGIPADILDYAGIQILLEYGGVTSKDNASAVTWPDCAFPAAASGPGWLAFACTTGIGAPPSTHTGLIWTKDFNCAASGTLTMIHGASETQLVDYEMRLYYEGDGTTETLVINCIEAPTPTVPAVGGVGVFPEATDGGASGDNAVILTGIIAAIATGCAALLGGAAWYARWRSTRA